MLSLAELTKHCYMIPSKSQNAESNRMSNVLTFLLTKMIDSFPHGKVLHWYSTAKHTSKFNYFLIIAKQDKPKIDNLFEVTECLLHELSLIIEIYKYSSPSFSFTCRLNKCQLHAMIMLQCFNYSLKQYINSLVWSFW